MGRVLPRLGQQVEDAVGQHEHQEEDGDDHQHGGDLLLVPHAPRPGVKVVGQPPLGAVGPLDVDDDEDVAGEHQQAGHDGVGQGVGPVPVVHHELAEVVVVGAAGHQRVLGYSDEVDGAEGEGQQADGHHHQAGTALGVDAAHL